jgi:hypothetical protein
MDNPDSDNSSISSDNDVKEPKSAAELNIDPSWEKWRNEQIQTISNILSNVFKVEDEVSQIQAPSRLLRNPARQSAGNEEDVCEKLNAIRQQISEYEQVLQLSLKRIDKALKVIQPEASPQPTTPVGSKRFPRMQGLKKWMRKRLARPFLRKKKQKP